MTDRLQWGIIGPGRRAREVMIPALLASPRSRVLGVAGSEPKRAQEAVAAWPALRVYARADDLVADPEVDAVYISTPHFLHVPQAVQAIDAGKHVLMESPMALSVDGAHKLVEKARARGVKIGLVFPCRYHGALQYLKARLEAPETGRLLYVEVHCAEPAEATGGWWTDTQRSGPPILLRFGVPGLELATWLKSEPILEVAAMSDGDAEPENQTMVSILIRFSDQALGVVLGANSFSDKDHSVRVECQNAGFHLQGDFTGQGHVLLRENRGGKETTRDFEPEDPVGNMLDAFVSMIKDGKDYRPDGAEGRKVVEATCAAIEAIKSRRTIKAGDILRLT